MADFKVTDPGPGLPHSCSNRQRDAQARQLCLHTLGPGQIRTIIHLILTPHTYLSGHIIVSMLRHVLLLNVSWIIHAS